MAEQADQDGRPFPGRSTDLSEAARSSWETVSASIFVDNARRERAIGPVLMQSAPDGYTIRDFPTGHGDQPRLYEKLAYHPCAI